MCISVTHDGLPFRAWWSHLLRSYVMSVGFCIGAFVFLPGIYLSGGDMPGNLLSHVDTIPRKILIRAPSINQLPQYYNGCEITAAAMLLQWGGFHTGIEQLIPFLPRDHSKLRRNKNGQITQWGDPNVGFVGSLTGRYLGYGVYHTPVATLLRHFTSRTTDLTGTSFSHLLRVVATGHPIMAWTTTTFAPSSQWVTWHSHGKVVRATWLEHTVLLVGYNGRDVFINNPLGGKIAQVVSLTSFKQSWIQMGRQALTLA